MTVRVAILSFWHIHGNDYANASVAHPDVEIMAVWDEDPARGQEAAARFGVPFLADLESVLTRDDIDAVIVTAPTSMHGEVIIAAARAKKHIFTEKVLAATLEEAQAIVREVDDAGILLSVSLWRSHEWYVEPVAKTIASGVLGEITGMRIRDGHPLALKGALPAGFWERSEALGGILIDMCHPVYLSARWFGLPETVSALFGHVTGRELEDNVVLSVRYPNGAIGSLETSSVSGFAPFTAEIHGTEGSLVLQKDGIGEMFSRMTAGDPNPGREDPSKWPHGVLRIRSPGLPDQPDAWSDIPMPATKPLGAFEAWVETVKAGKRDFSNIKLALELTAIIESAYASDREGRTVNVRRPEIS